MVPITSPSTLNTQQLRELFRTHREALLRCALPITGCRYWAEDVVHDAFVRLLEAPCTQEIQQPLGYLMRIVRNLAIDKSRRIKLETRIYTDTDIATVSVDHTSPERIASEQDTLRQVVSALEQLPERTQKMFAMHRVSGMTQKQIASSFGISPTLVNFAVRHAAFHCSASLREHAA